MEFMAFIAAGRWRTLNVSSFRGSKYVSSFFCRLTQEDDSARNINMQAKILSLISLEFVNRPSIDFNSQQRKLLSQNETFSFFFGPVRYHIWKEFLARMVSEGYHWKMFQNNEAFASLVVIGIVTLGSKVVFRKECCS